MDTSKLVSDGIFKGMHVHDEYFRWEMITVAAVQRVKTVLVCPRIQIIYSKV